MRVEDITCSEGPDGVEWSARVTFADQERTLRFGGPADLVDRADASPFLVACLLPAMAWQQDLHVDGPVSPRLLAHLGQVVRTYRAWDPSLRAPEVTVASAVAPTSTGSGIACFFSRGIDSTYSAAVDRIDPGPLDALVYCRTLEPNHTAATSDRELELARRSAAAIGLPLHAVWTDLRAFTDPMLGWSTMHGAGLAALALLVGQAYDHVVVPSAYDVATLPPTGSHPLLDPLFSSEAVRIHHDHLDRDRQRKVDWLVAHRPDLLPHLKVCYAQDGNENCGRCHKCLLTMSSLRAAGALHLATTFPPELDLHLVRDQRRPDTGVRTLWLGIHRQAAAAGDVELRDAIADMFRQTATPSLRQLLAGRNRLADRLLLGRAGHPPYDPEHSTTFERFDRRHSDLVLELVRHGGVLPHERQTEVVPPPSPLRASTVVGALAASVQHRRARRAGRADRQA